MTDELKPMPEDDEPAYPPVGTPETALILTLGEENYTVIDHTGRFFHAQCVIAGYDGEEVLISDPPDDPGYYVFEGGKPWQHTDWETSTVDDYGICGTWRPARLSDLSEAGVVFEK